MTYQEFQKRYQYHPVNDRIGKGGFGVVFKAYDTYLDRYVALKMSEVADENDSTRLANEVKLAAKLPVHPNIAHYEECYTFATPLGTYDFGVLQFYNDGSLDDLIKKNVLTTDEKISILKQILNGIGFLHSNRIVHRDLKPRNILIARRGEKYIPKITDFGISKEFDAANSAAFGNSMVGAGTLAYSSPEQLSERSMHRNTDLWSYGVIAYQLFTGELPFTTGSYSVTSSDGRMELFRQVNSGILPEAVNTIPEPWQGAIRRLLVVDPMVRFRGCTAVKDYIVSGKEQEAQSPASSADAEEEDLQETRREISAEPVAKKEVDTPAKKATSPAPVSEADEDVESTRRESTPQPVKPVVKPAAPKAEPVVSSTPKKEVPPTTVQEDRPKSKKPWIWIGAAVVAVLLGVLLWPKGTPQTDFDSLLANADVVERVNGVEIPMVYVPGGTFTMGATSEQGSDAGSDEKPTHQVTLDGFYIGTTEVTQAQWEAVMGDNPSVFRGANLPVDSVSYDDALEFCRCLSELTGKHYTLPTEAQWEYAARGGQSGGTKYSGGNTIGDVAWYDGNSNGQTHPVATKSPNALGLYDMSGNVWEWCLDWYGDYPSLAQTNPQGPSSGDSRVRRGGSWLVSAESCRVSSRTDNIPSDCNFNYGFRIVCIDDNDAQSGILSDSTGCSVETEVELGNPTTESDNIDAQSESVLLESDNSVEEVVDVYVPIYFDEGSCELDANDRRIIQSVANAIANTPNKEYIIVGCYSSEIDEALSLSRAEVVRNELIRCGVNSNQLFIASGYGLLNELNHVSNSCVKIKAKNDN